MIRLIFFVLWSAICQQLANCDPAPNCRTYFTGPGKCISVYDCPIHVNIMKKLVISPEDRNYLINSQCDNGVGHTPHVCCSAFVEPPVPASGQGNILPTLTECGRESTGDRIYSGLETHLDEFPWMALLEYSSKKGRTTECGGTLINKRYVLTAAHCVKGRILKEVGPLVAVRLGEYDTTTDPDCYKNTCADPYVEAGVEETIAHPDYADTSKDKHNDIALIRLDHDVQYTEFIKPVCLPSMIKFRHSQVGDDLTVAGWGRTLTARTSSKKLKLPVPVYDHDECKRKYLMSKKVDIVETQLCAGGKYIEDSCNGDSGGPLMQFERGKWVIEGIVSYGNKCGLEGWPGVYTRVAYFDDWIKSTLKP